MPLFEPQRPNTTQRPDMSQVEDEQVSNFIQNFLNNTDQTTREEILRESSTRLNRTNQSFQFIKNLIDIIGFGLFPILLARILKKLLSAVTFSQDILFDIFEFYNNTQGTTTDGLIYKFLLCHQQHDQQQQLESQPSLEELWGSDWTFTGPLSFAKLPYKKCLITPNESFDIGIIGMPFDTAVTYRPGARFGPRALRIASSRQSKSQGFNFRAGLNPYESWAKVLDCGDVPITPMDNEVALRQMDEGYKELLKRETESSEGDQIPRLIMLGGDHSILLSSLRNLYQKYGKINVIHFDSHLDTWSPKKYSSYWKSQEFTHGSMLWMANEEGLINDKNVHVGLRSRLTGWEDYNEDDSQGWLRIHSDEIMEPAGLQRIAQKIKSRLPHDEPVYISVDIDVLDPSVAPATGTIEPGGLLTRELIYLIRSLEDFNIVGADLVEVSPSYDHAEITATAGSQIIYEILTNMIKKGPLNLIKKEKQKDDLAYGLNHFQDVLNDGLNQLQNVLS
ncbi:putative agmatinase 1 [Wickerhamomyces ciferrii]|uniref:Agmatinase 1 n=1 Tax=Wickerhamomyces ciferrii (strain ATCC 14091 / BCRC 22168 / CBS 111 / JCM 3599 / NBRC 0793 / NRRL Y-1031 F-60-10) TaxID=1206466 RepID=K0KLA3_WICCF|nr:putative agmatinase 1 [Wickerhamomyces ciferrii]CCH42982.1 putative agmatinase 1 [Wickerhamomyces ciferrii]